MAMRAYKEGFSMVALISKLYNTSVFEYFMTAAMESCKTTFLSDITSVQTKSPVAPVTYFSALY